MKTVLYKRLLIGGLIAVTTVMAGSIPAMAATEPVKAVESVDPIAFEPFADVLEWHWRTVNGVLQFRIWNRTRGRWENEWTNVI